MESRNPFVNLEISTRNIEEAMRFIPYCDGWEGQAGRSQKAVHVDAVLADDTIIGLEESYRMEHACSYDKTEESFAPTVGEQISGLNVKALIFHTENFSSYQDGYDEEFSEILYITPPDYKKIRRRVEEHLRKSGDAEIFRLAVLAGVKIY